MKLARRFGGVLALGALVAVAVLYGRPVAGFDIQDSPTLVARPGADISDVYLFPSPTNANDVVAVMDVHPGLAAGTGSTAFFDPQVLYTMKFDTRYSSEAVGSSPIENIVIQFSMSAASNGTQQIFVYGPAAPNQTGTSTTLVTSGFTTGTGLINQAFPAGTLTVFAGVREDPFFFDLNFGWPEGLGAALWYAAILVAGVLALVFFLREGSDEEANRQAGATARLPGGIWPLGLYMALLGLGFMFVVAAELMGASEGLGYLLLDGHRTLGVFTGGSLLVGAAARTDLVSPEQTEPLARAQIGADYQSFQVRHSFAV